MKLTLLTILSVLALSCASCNQEFPNGFQDEQCSPQFKIIKDDQGKEWVDVAESICRCRQYQVTKSNIGPVDGKVTRKPLAECNLMKGYTPKVDTKFVNFMEWIRLQISEADGLLEP